MKLLDKIKNIFIEDPDDDDKDDKLEYTNEFTREIKIEEKTKDKEVEIEVAEKDLYKSPSTFKFPVIFEDEDMKPMEEKKSYTFDRPKPKVKEEKEEKKFMASPIISPIYGILDKNYKKDEITNKSEQPEYEDKRKYNINVDIVRQKAFGTLEEDLAQTIMEDKGYIYGVKDEELETPKEEVKQEEELANEMGLNGEEPKPDVTIAEAYENYADYGVEYKSEITEEEEVEVTQKTEVLDDDLFELINSMYKENEEEGEEEEDK